MATWIGHPELLVHQPVRCVDGRATGEVIGTPGGTLGEIVAVLSAYEDLTGEPLDAATVARHVEAVRQAFGHVYHHSDREALRDLPDDPEALLTPEHTGCGHLAAILTDPGAYGVRRELVQHVLRAFFEGLRRGDPGYVFEVLDGEHDESEVVIVHSCGRDRAWGRTPTVVPRDSKAFVFHRDAARWFRRQVCLLVADDGWPQVLIEAADRTMDRHLAETLLRLASGLPQRDLQPPCDEVR